MDFYSAYRAEREDNAKLRAEVERLRAELRAANESIEAAEYRQHVAEWALVGIGRDATSLRMAVSGMSLDIKGADPFAMAEHMGKTLARALIHQADIEFRGHASMYEARQHIHYLENHARANGLPFTPYLDKVLQERTDKPPRGWRRALRAPD